MSKYGIVGEVGLVGKDLEAGSVGYAFYQELQRLGWDIDNHSYDYTWVDATTIEELEQLFFASWDVMSKYGMNAKDVFLYPDGDVQSQLDGVKNLIAKYTKCARMTGDISAFTNQWPTAEPHRLYSLGFRDTLSLAQALQALDQLVAEKSLGIDYCHYLVTGSAGGVTWNDADMETYLQAVKAYVDSGDLVCSTLSNMFGR